jgi:hypothetical protein
MLTSSLWLQRGTGKSIANSVPGLFASHVAAKYFSPLYPHRLAMKYFSTRGGDEELSFEEVNHSSLGSTGV